MAGALKESEWKKLFKDNPSATDPGLADALKEYTKTQGNDVDQQLEALEEVVEMAEETKKLSIKSKNKEVTRYLDGVLAEARQEMEGLENEEQDPVDFLDDEEAYKNYLKKMMKKLTKKPMYFAAVLGQKPNEHKIIFHKSQDGKKLLKTLKDATNLKKFAWGLAGGHAEQTSTLTLALEGPQIGGIKKKGEKLLKYYKPLAFDTILLMVDGEIVEDIDDADDADDAADASRTEGEAVSGTIPPPPPAGPQAGGGLINRLKALTPRIKEFAVAADAAGKEVGADLDAKKAALAPKNQLLTLVRDCQAMIGKNDEQAEAMLFKIEAILNEGQGNVPSPPPAGPQAGGGLMTRLKALTPRIKEFAVAADAAGKEAGADLDAKKAALDPKNRLLTLVRDCQAMIGKNDEQANQLLDEVEKLLNTNSSATASADNPDTAPSPESSSVSLVKLGKARVEFINTKRAALRSMENVKGAFEAAYANAPSMLNQLKEALKQLDRVIAQLNVDLEDQLDDILNAADPAKRDTLIKKARATINSFASFVDSNVVMQNLDGNEFLPSTQVTGPIRSKLKEIAAALG